MKEGGLLMNQEKIHECPYCGSSKVTRARRKNWMRLLPFSEYRSCRRCQGKHLLIFGFIKIHLDRGFSKLVKLSDLLN